MYFFFLDELISIHKINKNNLYYSYKYNYVEDKIIHLNVFESFTYQLL